MMAKDTAHIGIRVSPATKRKLEALAKEERRSVSNWVLTKLEPFLEPGSRRPAHG